MNLKPQDVLFLLKLVANKNRSWTFNKLAVELNMSPSEVHACAQRALLAKLAVSQGDAIIPNNRNLLEFLEHGIQYVFIPETGGPGRGMPTAHAAPPFNLVFPDTELAPVWPDPDGDVRGIAFSPLYKSAPAASRADPDLYELLALVDCIRAGRAREKNWAIKELNNRINNNAPDSKS